MKRVLITGMSGTGKSSLIASLAALGYKAVDTDDGWCEPQPDGRQRWREDAIQELLATEDTGVLFVAGCEENQVKFHPWFDHIVLLSETSGRLPDRHAWAARTDAISPTPTCSSGAGGARVGPARRRGHAGDEFSPRRTS